MTLFQTLLKALFWATTLMVTVAIIFLLATETAFNVALPIRKPLILIATSPLP